MNKKDLALEAVLLFHDGEPWTVDKKCRWDLISMTLLGAPTFDDFHYLRRCAHPNSWEATTKVLCKIVRAGINDRCDALAEKSRKE